MCEAAHGVKWLATAALGVSLMAAGPSWSRADNPGHTLADRFATDSERARQKTERAERSRRAAEEARAEAERSRREAERRDAEESEMLGRARAEAEARRAEQARSRAQTEGSDRPAANGAPSHAPAPSETADDRRRAEEERRAEQHRAAEAARQAEAQRAAAHEAELRRSEDLRRAEERAAEHERRREAEAQRAAEEKVREAERRAAEEAARHAAQQAAEERRAALAAERGAEARRIADALKQAEAQRSMRERAREAARETDATGPPAASVPATGPRPTDLAESPTPPVGSERAGWTASQPGRVAVLLLMQPGDRGIRRHSKTADPVLCTADGCYVSNGADAPARLMPHRKALGFFRTWGARAGACSNSLGCVFRDVDMGQLPGSLQPVDMRVVRHDRRPAIGVSSASDCRAEAGRLLCGGAYSGDSYALWVVPESVAATVGPAALEQALAEGLSQKQQASLPIGRAR